MYHRCQGAAHPNFMEKTFVGDSKATKFVNVFSPSHVFPCTVFPEFLHKSGNLIVLEGWWCYPRKNLKFIISETVPGDF